MKRDVLLNRREQRQVRELSEALGASRDLHQVLRDGFRLLLPLIGADHGALAVGRGPRPERYQWIVQNLPPSYLGSYAEMAPHDFVRTSVMARPNLVLRDTEMVDRRTLERNMMYVRAREVGAPLEHVMAVMLHVEGGFQSGLSLYRERRRPFSERERLILQQVTGVIGNAVRNCCLSTAQEVWITAMGEALRRSGQAIIIVGSPVGEDEPTPEAEALLSAHFPAHERRGGALPAALLGELARARAQHALGGAAPIKWRRPGVIADLHVTMSPLPKERSGEGWMLVLKERPHVPAWFREELTPREIEVVSGVLQGWDNALIAAEVGCKPNTVKKHLRSAYTKLGVEDRRKLMALAGDEE